MDITCTSCSRSFQLDPERVKKNPMARCVCGARLRLQTDPNTAQQGPQRLGKYLLLQRIAVGGMGEIFYGKIAGIEGFEREVAIKKMLPHLSEDRAFVDMMVKEAKLTVMLHHPNIVQVYDLAREGKEYYIAMEFVPGVTVGHLLERCHRERTRLPLEIALHIAMQVLRGLAYAHDLRDSNGEPMNVLHRDITPQNILVTRNAWVKITDFGIAKARNEISTTSPGMIKGKLGYIAPEQLSGGQPDQGVDIFCAGILLWESLATRRLFKGTDEIDTFRLISECRIPPLGNFRDDVSPAIEKALLGGLARLPEQRYRTADAFYDALNQAIYPNTADECASIAKRYFESHPEFFESIAKLIDAEQMAGQTVALEVPSDEGLVEVTDLLTAPAKPKPRLLPVLAVSAAALIVLLLVGILFRDDLVARIRPPRVADPPSVDRLSNDEVQLAVDGERARFRECCAAGGAGYRKVPTLTARLVIPSTGGVAEIVLDPSIDKLGKAGPCIERIIGRLKFRPHDDKKFVANVILPPPKDCPGIQVPPDKGPSPTAEAKPLTGPEIQAAVQKSSAPITACIGDLAGVSSAPNKVNATIVINQNGKVSDVSLSPQVGVPSVDQCLRRALLNLRFRRQPIKDFKVVIPLSIQQI